MKSTETLVGLVVLGALVAGVFVARTRHTSTDAALPGAASAPPADTASSDEGIPDVTLADATVGAGDVRITLSVAPRPPVAFATNRFRVRVARPSGPGPAAEPPATAPPVLEGGRISFEMTMPMGEHRYALVPRADGWHEAAVVLPMCASGNPRWYATVEGTVAGRAVRARYRLELARPGSS